MLNGMVPVPPAACPSCPEAALSVTGAPYVMSARQPTATLRRAAAMYSEVQQAMGRECRSGEGSAPRQRQRGGGRGCA